MYRYFHLLLNLFSEYRFQLSYYTLIDMILLLEENNFQDVIYLVFCIALMLKKELCPFAENGKNAERKRDWAV